MSPNFEPDAERRGWTDEARHCRVTDALGGHLRRLEEPPPAESFLLTGPPWPVNRVHLRHRAAADHSPQGARDPEPRASPWPSSSLSRPQFTDLNLSEMHACHRVFRREEALRWWHPGGGRAFAIPEVIVDGVTGVLHEAGVVVRVAAAVETLLKGPSRRQAGHGRRPRQPPNWVLDGGRGLVGGGCPLDGGESHF